MAATSQEAEERRRKSQRDRINRLRADPDYRAAENVKERIRQKERMATEPDYASHCRELWREQARKRRAKLRAVQQLQQAAE